MEALEVPDKPKRHRGGRTLTTFQKGIFCAWDGEGVTGPDGVHRYVLLCSSQRDAVWNDAGVGTMEALSIITARARELDRRTIHCVFGGSYDMNCWLRDLTPFQLSRVWSGAKLTLYSSDERPHPVFRVEYRPRRSLKIWDLVHGSRVTVWDVWGFFQGSFIGALEKYNLPVPDHVRAGKLRRSQFTLRERKKITSYCQDECRLLVDLMTKTREYLAAAQLPITRWDGAGACAAALLTKEGTRAHQGVGPDAVRRAARYAYAGGRIEMVRYGHIPKTPIHHYDICSAYPSAARSCPSLAAGRWEPGRQPDNPGAFAVALVEYDFSYSNSGAFPFFWRAPNGSIFYPSRGLGWYWWPEVVAAQAAVSQGALRGHMRVRRCYTWEPAGAPVYPFAFIARAYEQRRLWKSSGVGAEKALKLAMNSLYGKCAQHSGAKGKAPAFHQLEWAGYITSVTRAQLFTAAAEAGPTLIMLATDGIFATAPIPSLAIGSDLGQWEYHEHHGGTFVQSGVYWLDAGKEETAFSRGFDKGSLNRRAIVRAWRDGATVWDASLTRFVTMGAVVSGQEKPHNWRQWRTAPRVLSLTPSGSKRRDLGARQRPAAGLVATAASVPAAQLVSDDRGRYPLSTIYPLSWERDPAFAPDEESAYWAAVEWDAQETD